jgi:Ca2+/Na+ antiporter
MLMRLTQITGIMLILVGVIAYATAETTSLTALFPAVVGVVLAALGLIAQAPKFRRDAVHIAVLIGLIGIVAFFDNARHLPALLAGNTVERPQAVVVSALTVAILITYLVLSIRSFRRARKERENA